VNDEKVMMNDILWTERAAGEIASVVKDDPTTILIGGDPNWVRLPPELGGGVARVLETVLAPCPFHREDHRVRTHVLEGEFYVAECTWIKSGIGFYKLKEKTT